MKKNKLRKSKQHRARSINALKGLKEWLKVLAKNKKEK